MSPSFITRAETSTATPDGGSYALSSWEMASRLSYTLWGTMPDDTLFTRRAAEQAARRRRTSWRRRSACCRTRRRARRWPSSTPRTRCRATPPAGRRPRTIRRCSRRSRPRWSRRCPTEAQKFFDYITFDLKGTFQDLMTKPVAFVNKDLAPIYGLTAASYGTDLTMVNLDRDPARGRVHARRLPRVVLVVQPHVADSPRRVPREAGAVQADPGAAARRAPSTPLPDDREHQPRAGHRADVGRRSCAGCHAPIVNPPGFALEAYDSIGSLADDGEGHRRRHRQHGRRRDRRRRPCTSPARST